MPPIDEIIALVGEYMPEKNGALLRKAYDYALVVYEKHADRMSGEAYISHPLAVAKILAQMRLDIHTVIAGLLHKALRGRPKAAEEEMAALFGQEVARIVSGATK